MLKRSLIIFLVVLTPLAAEEIKPNDLFKNVERYYPKIRYWSAGTSLFFGGLAVTRGAQVGLKEDRPDRERMLGASLVGLGVVRSMAAIHRMIVPYPVETLAKKNYPKVDDRFRTELEQASQTAFRRRMYKGLLSWLMAANYLALYNTDRREHSGFIYSGGVLAIVGLISFFALSPEEKAWRRLQTGKVKVSYDVGPAKIWAAVTGILGN